MKNFPACNELIHLLLFAKVYKDNRLTLEKKDFREQWVIISLHAHCWVIFHAFCCLLILLN